VRAGLARVRSSGQQDTFGSTGSETAILFRVFQEVDDFVDLRLHFVNPSDVRKRDADRLGSTRVCRLPRMPPSAPCWRLNIQA